MVSLEATCRVRSVSLAHGRCGGLRWFLSPWLQWEPGRGWGPFSLVRRGVTLPCFLFHPNTIIIMEEDMEEDTTNCNSSTPDKSMDDGEGWQKVKRKRRKVNDISALIPSCNTPIYSSKPSGTRHRAVLSHIGETRRLTQILLRLPIKHHYLKGESICSLGWISHGDYLRTVIVCRSTQQVV